jgi:hypothetical protein
VEVKRSTHSLAVQSDLQKLTCEMRDAIDDLAMQKINISSVRVFGKLIVVHENELFGMPDNFNPKELLYYKGCP